MKNLQIGSPASSSCTYWNKSYYRDMDDIIDDFGCIFHLEVFRIANLRYETSCAVTCTLLAECKDLWRTHCNRTRDNLKRSVSASCRFKNYGKRLIILGDTSWNVKFLYECFSKNTEFSLPGQLEFQLNSRRKPSFSTITTTYGYWKLTSRFVL